MLVDHHLPILSNDQNIHMNIVENTLNHLAPSQNSCKSGKIRKHLYEGTKAFWKLRCTLDVFLQKHEAHNCIEVITFNATTGQESNHIFVDYNKVLIKLDGKELENALELKREHMGKRFNLAVETIAAQDNFVIQYILNRLSIVESTEDLLSVELKANYCDVYNEETKLLETIIAKPDCVTITEIKCQKIASIEEMKKMIQEVSYQHANIHHEMTYAENAVDRNHIATVQNPLPPLRQFTTSNNRRKAFSRRSIDDIDVMERKNDLGLALTHARKMYMKIDHEEREIEKKPRRKLRYDEILAEKSNGNCNNHQKLTHSATARVKSPPSSYRQSSHSMNESMARALTPCKRSSQSNHSQMSSLQVEKPPALRIELSPLPPTSPKNPRTPKIDLLNNTNNILASPTIARQESRSCPVSRTSSPANKREPILFPDCQSPVTSPHAKPTPVFHSPPQSCTSPVAITNKLDDLVKKSNDHHRISLFKKFKSQGKNDEEEEKSMTRKFSSLIESSSSHLQTSPPSSCSSQQQHHQHVSSPPSSSSNRRQRSSISNYLLRKEEKSSH